MTTKEVDAYLSEYQQLKKHILRQRENVREQRARLLPGSVRYDGVKVMVSQSDRLADKMASITDQEQTIDADIERLHKLKRQILSDIQNAIPDSKHDCRRIIELKYIAGLNVSEIAEKLDKSTRHVFRLKDSALTLMAEQLEGR